MSTIFKVCNSCISHSYFKVTVVLSYAGYGDSLKINEIALHLTDSNINSIVFHNIGTVWVFLKLRKNSQAPLVKVTISNLLILLCLLIYVHNSLHASVPQPPRATE